MFLILVIALFCVGIVALGLLGAIIACFYRKWKLAGWWFGGGVGVAAAIFGLMLLLWAINDPMVRKPVPSSAVIGSYHLDPQWADGQLSQMGYKDKSGRLSLYSDHRFIGTRIPACCIHGYDETTYPFSGGYYQLTGTWLISKTQQSDGNNYVVQLTIQSADLRDQPQPVPTNIDPERKVPGVLEVELIKGKPLSLGFHIFNGDFDYVTFLRDSN